MGLGVSGNIKSVALGITVGGLVEGVSGLLPVATEFESVRDEGGVCSEIALYIYIYTHVHVYVCVYKSIVFDR